MEAYMLNMDDETLSEGVPVRAAAWGLREIVDEGDGGMSQHAGISVFVDLGSVAFEVDIPLAEALACLFRATNSPALDPYHYGDYSPRTSFETSPEDAPMFVRQAPEDKTAEIERVVRAVGYGDISVAEGLEQLGITPKPCPECGADGCVDVEDLI